MKIRIFIFFAMFTLSLRASELHSVLNHYEFKEMKTTNNLGSLNFDLSKDEVAMCLFGQGVVEFGQKRPGFSSNILWSHKGKQEYRFKPTQLLFLPGKYSISNAHQYHIIVYTRIKQPKPPQISVEKHNDLIQRHDVLKKEMTEFMKNLVSAVKNLPNSSDEDK